MATLKQLTVHAESILGIEITVEGRRAAHYAPETGEAYWLTRDDLRYAADCAREYPSDTYSHWCAGTGPRQMSAQTRMRLFGR